ncbi:RING finger family protein [Allofrancisella inopinata]|uniref:RING-H2 finger protein n=1 Tax=Allofrancisella inopinata TaxID=1085647 RepID=A0AAE6YH20_9GAMM|nr:RING-H2 finger protein [Allofrancisella inopinata]QIV95785.1 RING-H2 finger protein [Allofrancisella inopinata]TDT72820.1 RING finger family protein [Allofrancisella inopinata]
MLSYVTLNNSQTPPQNLKLSGNDNDKTSCSICLDNFTFSEFNNSKICITTCGHFYHKNCIEQWLKSNHTCPLCKKELLKWDYEVELPVNPMDQNSRKVWFRDLIRAIELDHIITDDEPEIGKEFGTFTVANLKIVINNATQNYLTWRKGIFRVRNINHLFNHWGDKGINRANNLNNKVQAWGNNNDHDLHDAISLFKYICKEIKYFPCSEHSYTTFILNAFKRDFKSIGKHMNSVNYFSQEPNVSEERKNLLSSKLEFILRLKMNGRKIKKSGQLRAKIVGEEINLSSFWKKCFPESPVYSEYHQNISLSNRNNFFHFHVIGEKLRCLIDERISIEPQVNFLIIVANSYDDYYRLYEKIGNLNNIPIVLVKVQ